jgi:predicted phosphodiesterase
MLTAIAGDTHFPWPLKRAVKAFLARCKRRKPKVVIQIGDLYDLFAWSRFPKAMEITPRQEIIRARAQAEEFWQRVRDVCGRGVERYQIIGNHDERLAKTVMSKMPEFEPFLHDVQRQLWTFDGVKTLPSERDELILRNVCYQHGWRKHGDHVRHNLMSTVHGHTHRGGVTTFKHGSKVLWELDVGYLGDPNAACMSYSRQRRFAQMTHGMGEVEDMVPIFVPL